MSVQNGLFMSYSGSFPLKTLFGYVLSMVACFSCRTVMKIDDLEKNMEIPNMSIFSYFILYGYSQHYDHFLLLRSIYNEELATCSRPTNRRLDLNVVSVLYRWRQLQAVHANFILMNNAAHIMMFLGHAKLRAY